MRLVQHLHLLIPTVPRSTSNIRVEEEELRGNLEEMEEELKRSRVKGKLNENPTEGLKRVATTMGSRTAGADDGYLANEVENKWSSATSLMLR